MILLCLADINRQQVLYADSNQCVRFPCNCIAELLRKSKKINLQWIMELYRNHPHKEKFFDSKLSREMNTIELLVGTDLFRKQIIEGKSEKEIRASWEPGLSEYKRMREKYLLYR